MSSLSHKELVVTLNLFSSGTITSTTMELTKLLLSCLLVIILSEAFLGSGRLSEIHFTYFFLLFFFGVLVSGSSAIFLQIRAQDENVRASLEFNIIFYTSFKCEISLSHFYFN